MLGAIDFALCAQVGKPLASQEVRAQVTREAATKISEFLGSGQADSKARGKAGAPGYLRQAPRVIPAAHPSIPADETFRQTLGNQSARRPQPTVGPPWQPDHAKAAGNPAPPDMGHDRRSAQREPARERVPAADRKAQPALTIRQMRAQIIDALDNSGVMPCDYLWMIAMIAMADSEFASECAQQMQDRLECGRANADTCKTIRDELVKFGARYPALHPGT